MKKNICTVRTYVVDDGRKILLSKEHLDRNGNTIYFGTPRLVGTASRFNEYNDKIYEKSGGRESYWEYKYDEAGNKIYEKNPGGHETWFKYDKNNNRVYWKRDNGTEMFAKYDNNGNLVSLRDSECYKVCCQYDDRGNKIFATISTYERTQILRY